MTPANLSLVLNKKKGLSLRSAVYLSKKLKLTKELSDWFYNSVGAVHSRSQKDRNTYKSIIEKHKSQAAKFTEIQLEYFKVISDWYYFAILELTYIENFQGSNEWIAKVLEITEKEVEAAVIRLKKLGLLSIKNGKWKDTYKFLITPNDIPSSSLKKFNSKLIKKSLDAIYAQSVEEREIASHIFSIDKANLPELKKLLRQFRSEFEIEASKAKIKNEIYCLSISSSRCRN